jgi:hypothetical protein
MKEWVIVTPKNSRRWLALANDACDFIGQAHPPPEHRS